MSECIACKYSGIDEREYAAHGCPECICKNTAIPVKTSDKVEAIANETFEQKLYKASVDYSKSQRYTTSLVELEKSHAAGANWCREQMQEEIEELKHTIANTRLDAEWPVVRQLEAERAKSQKLVAALEANNFALQCMIIHFNGKVPGLTNEQVFEGAISARDEAKQAIKDYGGRINGKRHRRNPWKSKRRRAEEKT
jgi:alpha-galactosidase/6-phospho-beta-glucosidase family protein